MQVHSLIWKSIQLFPSNLKCLTEILEWKHKLLIVMALKTEIAELAYYSSMMRRRKFLTIIRTLPRR